MKKRPSLFIALLPIMFLILMLSINVIGVYGDDALSGSNQFILLLSGAFAAVVGVTQGFSFKQILEGIEKSVKSTTGAILILLLIGSLSGTWMISGVVPAMIYYGLQILSPEIFLPAAAIICALVSLATGSSWSTTATVGIALVGIGKAIGMSEAMVAGAVISGAYFGDKISPLSDTTNLAPAMAGTDLFTHIRYMLYTTVPSFLIALIVFIILSLNLETSGNVNNIQPVLTELEGMFNLTPWLFLVPLLVVGLIVAKIPALPAILAGTLAGALFAPIFQHDLLLSIASTDQLSWLQTYKIIMDSLTVSMSYPSKNPVLSDLLSSGGMYGMLSTVWLIIAAMVFGGVMEACGFLAVISSALLKLAKGTASLIATTAGTCVFINVTASDQYLAIVVPGRMYADAYRKRGLAPENLSRTLEDSGTVTSVLVPWNTCGAYQSGVLGVSTFAYLPYAVFNYLSPLMTLVFAIFDIKIRKLLNRPEETSNTLA
ncbi:Na+/H+ antiporter NhaC [Owenweeksia hongkongensis]|uniref:Na+/H+ antiporter NhaC n=1 Tax=Owenweeksia hongkongensis TaxID=253245 RepID=UPI003A929C51